MRIFLLLLCGLVCGLPLTACSDTRPTTAGPSAIDEQDGRVLIRDVTGKRWDVTEARNQYGILPGEFQHGLGPEAIPPILISHMLLPGEPGFPDPRADFLVIGVLLNGFTRAYPIQVLGWHEVATEKFGEAHVSVAF